MQNIWVRHFFVSISTGISAQRLVSAEKNYSQETNDLFSEACPTPMVIHLVDIREQRLNNTADTCT